MKLTIELVPKTSWHSNLRSMLSKDQWDKLRKRAYRDANYRCQICGGQGKEHPVECHETWEYNDKTHVQKLTGVIALCPLCHMVKHIGFAQTQGKFAEAFSHLIGVNRIGTKEAEEYLENIMEIWERRSEHKWEVDLTWLGGYKVR